MNTIKCQLHHIGLIYTYLGDNKTPKMVNLFLHQCNVNKGYPLKIQNIESQH
jgi:hypothetical protein